MTAIPGRPTLRQQLSAMLAETRLRMLNITRYPGQMITEIIIPIVFAAGRMPRQTLPRIRARPITWRSC